MKLLNQFKIVGKSSNFVGKPKPLKKSKKCVDNSLNFSLPVKLYKKREKDELSNKCFVTSTILVFVDP